MDKEQTMDKTKTTRYDVAEHLRTPEEMAAYLEACFEEAGSDAAFITKALGDIARAKGMYQLDELAEPTTPSDDRTNRLVQLVQSWIDEGDADEQRETLEYLIQALDEDRLSDRKLFPKELKGKSW